MGLKIILQRIIVNKVFWYLITRYLTYGIQFIVSIYAAIKLGPYSYGIWSFIHLLLSYFLIINFGISNSTNILLIQNKNNSYLSKSYIKTSIFFICILSLLIIGFSLYYYKFDISLFDKYHLKHLFILICIIAIFQHFNVLFSGIYRIKNKLFELSFYQSVIPFLSLIVLICFDASHIIIMLLTAHILGHILSLIVFITHKQISIGGQISHTTASKIFNKGFFLFLYNCCFYLILFSTSIIISTYYSIEKYGFYSFAYLIGNSIILFLDAFSFIIFPKVIDRLRIKDCAILQKTLEQIRTNYVSCAYLLGYIAFTFFPLIIYLIPKYHNSFGALNMVLLAILPYTNAFGYNSLLIAQNKEKLISFISVITLSINISTALFLALFCKISYEYIIIATMFSYILFAFACVYFGRRHLSLSLNFHNIINECFPLSHLIPYISAILISIFQYNTFLSFLPLAIFLFLNYKIIFKIMDTIKHIIYKPNIIDIT